MVLALPYFHVENPHSPETVAYMPFASQLQESVTRWVRCVPACFANGHSKPRRDFKKYFGREGLEAVERFTWGREV